VAEEVNHCRVIGNEIRFFPVKMQLQRNTIILSVDVKYSMRDLICGVIYCAWLVKLIWV